MINFRFHLVSLIAVFLALALGIVVGSTVIDRAIVDGLKAQIDRVERNAEEQHRENERLEREIGEVRTFAEAEIPFALEGRLASDVPVPVVIVALRGSNEDDTRAVVEAVRQAGAVAPAVLWIEPAWVADDQDERASLRSMLGLPRADVDDLRRVALEQLAARIAAGELVVAAPADGAVPAEVAPDPLTTLVDAGFVTVDPAGGADVDLAVYPGVGARVAVIGEAGVDGVDDLFPAAVRAMADASLLTLAAEVAEDPAAKDRGTVADTVRSSDDLKDRVATVDNASEASGRLAVVLALADLGRGQRGHYGTASGASALLPAPPGP